VTIAFTNGKHPFINKLVIIKGLQKSYWNKVNSSKENVKTELFPMDSISELSYKNMGNSPSFLTITHMTLSAKWFRSYGILTINVAAEFFFWTQQQLNGSSHLGFGLAETPEALSTILVGNSHRFPMIHNMATTG
jgi:hypothetical protein